MLRQKYQLITSKDMMIKASWDMIKPEGHMAKPNQEWQPQILLSLKNYLHAQN